MHEMTYLFLDRHINLSIEVSSLVSRPKYFLVSRPSGIDAGEARELVFFEAPEGISEPVGAAGEGDPGSIIIYNNLV